MDFRLENLRETRTLTGYCNSEWYMVEAYGIAMAKQGGTVTVTELCPEYDRPIGHITTGGYEPPEPSYVQ